MVATVFRVSADEQYDFMRITETDYEDWKRRMLFEEATRGVPLAPHWNEDWEFTTMDEDTEEHPCGLGDFAEMNSLIVATNQRAYELLAPLLGAAAEVLEARHQGGRIWLLNVIRRVDRGDINALEEGAVFRVNPVGLNTFCLPAFKEAVESSGLKGLSFSKVDWDEEFGLV